MALSSLASIADVEARIGRQVLDNERVQVQAMLTDASAVVRNYTRRSFTLATTTDILRPIGATVKLPERPVVSVTTLSLITWNQVRIPIPSWFWDGLDEVWVGGSANDQLINLPEALYDIWADRTPLLEVTYVHGYQPIPDDIVAVAAGMVVRTQTTPGRGTLSGEGAGDYSYRVSFHNQLGPLALSDADRMILNTYKRNLRSIEMRP